MERWKHCSYPNQHKHVSDENGEWVLYDDAQATIARLTAERDEARASTAAAYERAAHLIECDGDALGGKNGAAKAIRALAAKPGTTALAEIVKRAKADGMREAEAIIREMWASTSAEHSAAILARLDQRKEAGEC